MGRIGVVIHARVDGTRPPGTVLREVAGRPVLGHLLDRLEHAGVDAIVVTTSDALSDDPVAAFAARSGAYVRRGAGSDALAAAADAARTYRLATVVRVAADSPLLDPALVGRAVAELRTSGADLAGNVADGTFPPGQEVEAFTRAALDRACTVADSPADHTDVTRVMYRRPDLFHVVGIRRDPAVTGPRLVVRNDEDVARVAGILVRMGHPRWRYGLDDILDLAA